jgi:2-methylcitrate dehydratase PrpD
MTLAERLGHFAAGLSFDALPTPVVESAKDRVMDTLGICVAARNVDAVNAARRIVAEWGGRGDSTLIGESVRRPAASAALFNGTCAHSLDFDDTHLPSIVHPSAMLVPAVLAQAEACGSDGSAAITALIAGYEICTRLSMAQYDAELGNSVMFERGLHATSLIGTVAGAAACARLRGLDAAGITAAMAIACSMSAGLIEANRAGGTVKKFHGGWTGHSSVSAAAAAAHGLTGPPTVFEGRFGFFAAYCGERWHPEAVVDGLGERWDTPGIFYKPYPTNHFTHALVDAAIALKLRGVRAEEVVRITLGTAAASWRTIGDPIEEKRRPRSPYHAQFSAPFVFAAALAGGSGLGVSLDDFTETTLADALRRRLAANTEVVVDDECTRLFPHQFPGVARVVLDDGRELEERVLVNRGGPQRPLSRDELVGKLELNAGPLAAGIAAATADLDQLASIHELMAHCV